MPIKMKKKCDLCSRSATSYCESDDASLCWACDAAVHHANFLAAKHSRVVLCRVCQDPTRWTGSGVQLDPATRACPACTVEDNDDVTSDDNCTDEDEESDGVKDDDEEDEDQVVPTPMCIATKI
ncbi:hypothetical protein V2J09_019605 [Rumex salicifolius]